MLEERIESVFLRKDGKAVYPLLFICFFLVHFIGSFGLNYPATDPNELSVIATGEWFIGKSWAGVMCSVDYYYGFLQGLIYAPVLLLFNTPQAQYMAMLAVNSIFMSFIPVMAFSCAKRLKIEKNWQRLIISVVSGGYCCYFAHAKFAWPETVTIVFPWLLLWLLLRAGEIKNKWAKRFFSLLIGFCCGLSLAAHTRLIAVVLAVIAAVIAERVFYGKKTVYFIWLLIPFAVTASLAAILSSVIQTSLWCHEDPSTLVNTAANFIKQIGEGIADGGLHRLIQTFFGQIYYFVTATWGFGAIALCIFAVILYGCIKSKRASEEQHYSDGVTKTAFFMFFSVLFTVIIGMFYRFSGDGFAVYQDTTMFGRFLDSVMPFALMLTLTALFLDMLKLSRLFGASVVLLVSYAAFFSATLPVILECGSTRITPILALYPLQIGKESNALLSFESLLLTASVTFCVMALLVVVVSCTKRFRSVMISLMMVSITIYSAVFIQGVYLPLCRTEAQVKNEAVLGISESVYNQDGAPAVTAYNLSRHESLLLQFLNQNINVRITYDIESIPENCYIATKSDEDVSALANGRRPFLLVSESDDIRLYAYGERALAYMQSQNTEENEDISEPLITEKTTVSENTEPPLSEPVVSQTSTLERAPIVSTYTLPSVVTVPVDELGTEDEWAVIE